MLLLSAHQEPTDCELPEGMHGEESEALVVTCDFGSPEWNCFEQSDVIYPLENVVCRKLIYW